MPISMRQLQKQLITKKNNHKRTRNRSKKKQEKKKLHHYESMESEADVDEVAEGNEGSPELQGNLDSALPAL